MQYAHSNTEYYTKALYFQKKSLNGKESASSSHTAQGEFHSSSATINSSGHNLTSKTTFDNDQPRLIFF